jgi:hypothetical protein
MVAILNGIQMFWIRFGMWKIQGLFLPSSVQIGWVVSEKKIINFKPEST